MKCSGNRLVCCILIAGLLCGCGNQIPELSEEDNAKISEYAAAKLLTYDKMYHSRLLTDDQMLEAQKEREEEAARQEAIAKYLASQEEDKKEDNQSGAGDGKDASGEKAQKTAKPLAELLGLEGIEISYLQSEVCSTYPSDTVQISENNVNDPLASFFAMNASNGCQLVVVKLSLKNTTSQDVTADMLSKKVRFTLASDLFSKKSTLVTMLEDDFSTMSKIVAPGESVTAALLCDVQSEKCSSLEGLKLTVKNGEESETYSLDTPNKKL